MDRRRWSEPVDERIVAEGMQLEGRELLRIERGAQLLLAVQAGALWITEEGKPKDIVVAPGRWYRIEGDALAIAMALEPAQVTISAPLAAAATWRIERVAPGAVPAAGSSSGRKRGSRIGRALTAAWLRLYRKGARAARRAAESSRHAEFVRLASQLDRHTRKDIGLEHYGQFAERSARSLY